jgi:outer membrane protein assembly factor BamE (lipoprotein component of BamABCDE complex)
VFRNALRNPCLSAALALMIPAAGLGGCIASYNQHGDLPDPDRIAAIHPGSTTRAQVQKLLGTPSSTGVFDGNSWYYISRRTKQVAFLDPDTLDQRVYVINFDGNGVVRSIDRKGLKDARNITPAPGATPAPGRELTFLEQILGNIGRFDQGAGSSPAGAQEGPTPPGG